MPCKHLETKPTKHRRQTGLYGDDAQPPLLVLVQLDVSHPAAVPSLAIDHLDVQQVPHEQQLSDRLVIIVL